MPATNLSQTNAEPLDRLLTQGEAARYLSLSERTIEGLRYKGGGPAYVRVSHRCIRYRLSALDQWIDSRTFAHTTAATAAA